MKAEEMMLKTEDRTGTICAMEELDNYVDGLKSMGIAIEHRRRSWQGCSMSRWTKIKKRCKGINAS